LIYISSISDCSKNLFSLLQILQSICVAKSILCCYSTEWLAPCMWGVCVCIGVGVCLCGWLYVYDVYTCTHTTRTTHTLSLYHTHSHIIDVCCSVFFLLLFFFLALFLLFVLLGVLSGEIQECRKVLQYADEELKISRVKLPFDQSENVLFKLTLMLPLALVIKRNYGSP